MVLVSNIVALGEASVGYFAFPSVTLHQFYVLKSTTAAIFLAVDSVVEFNTCVLDSQEETGNTVTS